MRTSYFPNGCITDISQPLSVLHSKTLFPQTTFRLSRGSSCVCAAETPGTQQAAIHPSGSAVYHHLYAVYAGALNARLRKPFNCRKETYYVKCKLPKINDFRPFLAKFT